MTNTFNAVTMYIMLKRCVYYRKNHVEIVVSLGYPCRNCTFITENHVEIVVSLGDACRNCHENHVRT